MKKLNSIMAAGVMLAAILFGVHPALAQIGLKGYGGGTIPVGEFARTDVDRDPPKSGATDGDLYGLEAIYQLDAASVQTILSVGYIENHFGNDVPTTTLDDTLQFVTPESEIDFKAIRAGIRISAFAISPGVSPSVGIGLQSGKVKVNSTTFFGPNSTAQGTDEATQLKVESETERVMGVYGLAGLTVTTSDRVALFADATYNKLFVKDAEVTVTITPSEGDLEPSTAKSDFEWWDVRAGVILYFPDLGL